MEGRLSPTFWHHGCHMMNHHGASLESNCRRYKAMFGVTPYVLALYGLWLKTDAQYFRIHEQIPFDRKWYSHKFHGPGLRYEVGIWIRMGNIVWVNGGPRCGEWPGVRLARDSYISMVRRGELTLAEKEYRVAWFKSAFEEDPQDLDVLKQRLQRAIHFDTKILDAESRVGRMLDELGRTCLVSFIRIVDIFD
ncbi:hypothetical protein B5M09_012453 [Aphanomyces astaci]|uniref:Uncharacterized protein n=1 Tax=Aphanomyces astaci TaxID=112090 RepID=A0A3R7WRI9_APHAT|nr:hypothetical protein B5M09_012453 [Aphanomyces astaci]